MSSRDYDIKGMTCASCVSHVTKAIEKVEDVKAVSVNLLTEKAHVEFTGDVDDAAVVDAVAKSGYEAVAPAAYEDLDLEIEGMTCASCVTHVEKAIGKLPGVESVSVNLLSNSASVTYDSKSVRKFEIYEAVANSGYKAVEKKDVFKADNSEADAKLKKHKQRVVASLVLAAIVMYIAMAPMISDRIPIPQLLQAEHHPRIFTSVQLVLTSVVVYIYLDIFKRGFKSLFSGTPNMDSLVAVGTLSAQVYSIYGLVRVFTGDVHFAHHLYFETVAVVLALIGLGKLMEDISKQKTTSAIKALLNLKPREATLLVDGEERVIDADEIRVGDILVVRPGEAIPMDGVVVEGTSSVDESMLTGESLPLDKTVDSLITMGTINLNGRLLIEATVTNENTKLAQIIRLVEDAQTEKAPIAKFADTVSGYFVPVVMVIAVFAGIIWFASTRDLEFSLTIFVTILVIACPCALGLATPTAIMVGTGVGASHGVFIKSPESLELAAKTNVVVFDKTGTLTHGKPVVTDIHEVSGNAETILRVAASLEACSNHPLGRAILDDAESKQIQYTALDDFKEHHGKGLSGVFEGKRAYIGNEALMHEANVLADRESVNSLADQGKTAMYVALGTELLGIIAVADSIKDEAIAVVDALHKVKIDVVMLTGDHPNTAHAIAKQLGITNVIPQVLPEEKSMHVKTLQEGKRTVMMVGDGINDAVALVQADVGVAIGTGTDVAVESSNIVLMRDDLFGVVGAIQLSKATLRNIKENLFWAFIYNLVGIPFAAGLIYALFNGPLLNPMIAGAAMAFSSVSVVLNALRLRRFKFKMKKEV